MTSPSGLRRVILNADDLGLTPGISDGILRAHAEGLLTSASLLVGGSDAARAARVARGAPRLGIGVHLALTAVRPILPPARVSSLVEADGRFPYDLSRVLSRLALSRISPQELEKEFDAQIQAALHLGLGVTHLDGHQHLHVHPRVLPIVIRLAKKYGISALRVPRPEPGLFRMGSQAVEGGPLPRIGRRERWSRQLKAFLLGGVARRAIPLLQQEGLRTTDFFVGLEHSGLMRTDTLCHVLEHVPAGVTEIMMHPGLQDLETRRDHPWGYAWEEELEALCAPRVAGQLRRAGIRLIHFGDLVDGYGTADDARSGDSGGSTEGSE